MVTYRPASNGVDDPRDNSATSIGPATANEKNNLRGGGIMKGSILSLNAGSPSVKFALFNAADNLTATVRLEIEDLD